jgi:hypothetical protein
MALAGFEEVSPCVYRRDGFTEFEVSTQKIGGMNMLLGGGYLRMLPWPFMAWMLGRYLKTGKPYVLYIHPLDLSTATLPRVADMSPSKYLRMHIGRRHMARRLEKTIALLEKYGVPLLLSGHMHIQHIITEGSVTEIATSSLTMGACQYGVLTWADGAMRYETRPVDVASWAARQGLDDERLADFAAYAMGRMESRTRAQAEEQLAARGVSAQEAAPLVNYACALNNAYFCGDLSAIPPLDPDGSLLAAWKESGSSFGSYFASIEQEIGKNHTRWHDLEDSE